MTSYGRNDIAREFEILEEEESSWVEFCSSVQNVVRLIFVNPIHHNSSNEHTEIGQQLVDRVLRQRSGDDCLQLYRMRPPAFHRLVSHLRTHYEFEGTRYISAEQRLAITLFILGHSASMRLAYIIFGHSLSTVHAHFHYVLDKLNDFSTEMVKPHPNYMHGLDDHRPTNPRHAPFVDCIGAIDGTHVPCVPPHGSAERYRNRKGVMIQNVLAVVDFNMCFTFAAAGWEGSTHDSRMLNVTMEDPNSAFLLPYGNKYYLVDSGFANKKGFLGPYRGPNTRYHMQEFAQATTPRGRQPMNIQERFNYLHSSCRNVVERSFGVWKKRFLILQRMPEYQFSSQRQIVLATMAVHNYLRRVDWLDPGFVAAMQPDYVPMELDDSFEEDARNLRHQNAQDRNEWDQFRNGITSIICD